MFPACSSVHFEVERCRYLITRVLYAEGKRTAFFTIGKRPCTYPHTNTIYQDGDVNDSLCCICFWRMTVIFHLIIIAVYPLACWRFGCNSACLGWYWRCNSLP